GWSRRAGVCAAFVLIVLPLHWRSDTIGIWEAPFAALLFALLVLMISGLVHGRSKPVTDGVKIRTLLGVAGLLSPPVFLRGGAAPVAPLITVPERRPWLLRTMSVTCGVTALLLMLPWTGRNAFVLGGFIPFRSNFGLELCIGNCDGADGRFSTTAWKF